MILKFLGSFTKDFFKYYGSLEGLVTVGGEAISNSFRHFKCNYDNTSGLVNFLLSVILSIYMLSSKESLITQVEINLCFCKKSC